MMVTTGNLSPPRSRGHQQLTGEDLEDRSGCERTHAGSGASQSRGAGGCWRACVRGLSQAAAPRLNAERGLGGSLLETGPRRGRG